MLSTEIDSTLPEEQLQFCLEPCCFDGGSIQQYEHQCQPYEDYQLQYQYLDSPYPAEYLSPSPDPSLLSLDPSLLSLDPSLLSVDPRLLSVDPRLLSLDPSLLSPALSPIPHGIMSVGHNISPISGAAPSPSDTTQPQEQQEQSDQSQAHPGEQQPTEGPFYQPPRQIQYPPHPNPPLGRGVLEALELAREDIDAMNDETIRGLLEEAITRVWDKVLAEPDTYILGKDEYSLFNFYQHRFNGNPVAIAARRRFWEVYRG
ncbi:hypothetical protein V8F20_007499 [Naviculisporaceae sp. PSN 640]